MEYCATINTPENIIIEKIRICQNYLIVLVSQDNKKFVNVFEFTYTQPCIDIIKEPICCIINAVDIDVSLCNFYILQKDGTIKKSCLCEAKRECPDASSYRQIRVSVDDSCLFVDTQLITFDKPCPSDCTIPWCLDSLISPGRSIFLCDKSAGTTCANACINVSDYACASFVKDIGLVFAVKEGKALFLSETLFVKTSIALKDICEPVISCAATTTIFFVATRKHVYGYCLSSDQMSLLALHAELECIKKTLNCHECELRRLKKNF